MKPNCTFCGKVIVGEADRAVYDEGWTHELCWWKRECARLQGVIDEMKDSPDGSYEPLSQPRHAQHNISLGSEPTQYGEFEASDLPPTEAGEPCEDDPDTSGEMRNG